MISPSADAARALTQAAVVALLCRRYHDLATWASEPLKQRIHFLAKADGSNLEDLYIWDSPQHLTRQQIFGFLHQHWSPDQLPLAPPEGAAAWEAALVYRKRLDQETIQALVPIGHIASDPTNEDASLLAVVLYAEQDVQDQQDESTSGGRKQGKNGLCWKYHNVVSIQQRDLATQRWELMSCTCHVPMNKSLAKTPIDTPQEEGKEDDEDDSDDDYWGQYGDEDPLSGEEEASAQHSRKRTEGEADEDNEDEYWHKYSQQQEKEEAAETKRKMEQSSNNVPEVAPIQASLPGQVDSTMLSSLLQMLVQEGNQQAAAEEIQDALPPQDDLVPTITASEREQDKSEEPMTATTTTTTSTAYLETPPVCSPAADDLVTLVPSQAKAMVSITLEAAVRQAALEGLSKEQVFALLENVYQSRSSE
ncbi:hypothetical protein BGZ74_010328 [Mortierella antarctica]|nr:hypothetical protein BGZ74_010328 [Mortierella antarctica]